MSGERFYSQLGRKTIITGHYGSGKTEFAVSLAMLIKRNDPAARCALIDIDIVNPYFRSRERRDILEEAGIPVYGSVFAEEVTAELPALGADIRAPLEDMTCHAIIDAGGNDTGALILNQFTKYFTDDETTVLAVINANRPDTSDLNGALGHINAIETITGLTVSGIVNNCHLLRETTADTIKKGHKLCSKISKATGKSLLCSCYPESLVDPGKLTGLSGCFMPLGLYMRPTWLDK